MRKDDPEMVEYMRGIDFPKEAISAVEKAWEKMRSGAETSLMEDARKAFLNNGNGDFEKLLEKIAGQSDVRREVADMAFLVSCLPEMRERYRKAGLPDTLFWDTAKDLTYKLKECYANRGVWGTFVTFWFPEFYRLERFCLGRLQFEHKAFPYSGVPGLEKGQIVYNCHIPSSGPLTTESVDDAFRRAKAFYKKELNGRTMPIYCSSWMLYPPHIALFPEGSNLRRFAERFTLIEAVPDPTNHDFWRIFDRPWDPALPVSELPEDTSIRRAFKAFLMRGNAMGSGKSILWLP